MYHSHRGAFHNNEEVEIAFREWLRMQKSYLYRDGILKLVRRWDYVLGELLKNIYNSLE
jgi:hypothetical protein